MPSPVSRRGGAARPGALRCGAACGRGQPRLRLPRRPVAVLVVIGVVVVGVVRVGGVVFVEFDVDIVELLVVLVQVDVDLFLVLLVVVFVRFVEVIVLEVFIGDSRARLP